MVDTDCGSKSEEQLSRDVALFERECDCFCWRGFIKGGQHAHISYHHHVCRWKTCTPRDASESWGM